jgi:NAD(P)-dependent dehydrogenase (short-subunit alcohol dehydrogenase family)
MAIGIDLEGRTILVCGVAQGGIGGATAQQAARAGATLVLVDFEQAKVDESVAAVEALGAKAHGLVADMTLAADTDRLVPEVLRLTGRIDGVVNNAGGTREGEWQPLEATSLESFRHTLNLNLEYVFRVCKDAANAMIAQGSGGSLVNVGSVSSLTGAPFHGPYGAAKSGIAALTRTMAFEWAQHGIRANTVHPGAVPSKRVMDRAAADKSGHTGTSNMPSESSGVVFTSIFEMANMMVFLLSDLASGVSGQQIAVDSGLSTKFCGGNRVFSAKKYSPYAYQA